MSTSNTLYNCSCANDSSSVYSALLFTQHLIKVMSFSDVLALVWPESHGFGLALGGSGLEKIQARPGLALAQAMAFCRFTFV
jgi:hypothetical protein